MSQTVEVAGEQIERGGAPEIIEGPGRYAVYEGTDGELVVARATGICETCRHCGCGEQAEPIRLPDFRKGQQHLIAWAMKNAGSGGGIFGMLKGLKARG